MSVNIKKVESKILFLIIIEGNFGDDQCSMHSESDSSDLDNSQIMDLKA